MRKRDSKDWGDVIINYLGKRCIYCGSNEELHIHHIIPLSLGGANVLANLELVCWPCHKKLHKQLRKVFPIKDKSKYKNLAYLTKIFQNGE